MGKIIAKTNLKKKPGRLYYVAFDEEGFLLIGEAVLCRGKGKKPNLEGDN